VRIIIRGGLVILAVVESGLGIWAQFFPESFYRDFPTVGLTPPFSEHLMRDFGGATLGLAVLLAAASVWLELRIVVLAVIAYLVFAAPHFVFHMTHLRDASATDIAFLVVSLGSMMLLSVVLLTLAPRALRVAATAE